MAKEGAKAIVPKVRFPEFEGNTHWTISKLGTRGRFLGGGTPSRENAEFWAGIHPWISSSDISDEEIRPVRPSRFITDEAVARSATQVVPAGSVLIVARVGVGKVAVSEEQLHTSQDFANLVPSSDSPAFLAYLLKSRKSALLAFNQGMAIKGFTRDDIAGLEVPIPDKPEQQKIADCLTSLDEVIAAQGRKVEALKAHKRGLMQQLFPCEGETRPRLRFPEFRDAPEWAQAPVRELFDTASGGTPDRSNPDYWGGSIPWVTTSLVNFNSITRADEYISEAGLQSSSAKVFPKGTVVVAMYGQGKTRGQAALLQVEAATNQACAALLPNSEIAPWFVFFSFCGRYEELRALSNSGGQENLSQGLIRELMFSFPTNPEEQSRIVDCLSSLTTQITAETNQLAALKTHKQGLMQQLFPVPEVV